MKQIIDEDEDELGVKEAMKRGSHWVLVLNIVFATLIGISLMMVYLIEDKWLAIQILLFLNFITFWSNMIIFVLSQRTILFAFRAENTIDAGTEELNQAVKKFKDAGITVEKVNRLEPLVDELSYMLDNVDIDNLSSAMDRFIKIINKSDYEKYDSVDKPNLDDIDIDIDHKEED